MIYPVFQIMPIYVYIDESGDLGFHPEKSSTHLIVTALFISNPLKLDRIIKNLRQGSFKKEFQKNNEIKGNKSTKLLKKRLLKKLNENQDIKIVHIIYDKRKVQNVSEIYDKNKLYNHIVGEIAKNIPFENEFLEIRIDKSKRKQILRDEFNRYFKKNIEIFSSCYLQNDLIYHSDSNLWSGLQFVDLLAWSEYQKISRNNEEYITIIDIEKQKEIYFKKLEINEK